MTSRRRNPPFTDDQALSSLAKLVATYSAKRIKQSASIVAHLMVLCSARLKWSFSSVPLLVWPALAALPGSLALL